MSTSNDTSDDDNDTSDKPLSSSLPKLLAALALGARSVNALPLVNNSEDDDGDDDDNDIQDDEISFLMSLPEFATLNNEAQQSVTSLLCQALAVIPSDTDDTDTNNTENEYEFDDPELWEQCANACDALYDRVMNYIETTAQQQSSSSAGEKKYESLTNAITNVSAQSRTNSSNSYNRMLNSIASMEKPQNVYQGFVTHPPQNSRDEPYTPIIVYDGNKQIKLDGGEYTKDGHGLDTRTSSSSGGGGGGEGEEKRDVTRRKYSPDMIAPTYHYDHPYSDEIDTLEYRPWQLNVDNVQPKDAKQIAYDNKNNGKDEDVDGVWIDNEDDLEKICKRIIESQQHGLQEEDGDICEISLDLEAHSHRTFAGFVCLIQLSLRRPRNKKKLSSLASAANKEKQQSSSTTNTTTTCDVSTGFDFVIDALALRHAIPTHLGPILANPNILKVMHGADSDIPWLQRDFGCYVVNLFDTGRAARQLKFPSAGLAYLLRKYVNIEADKVHQLSDWRRRPLPDDMRRYAVSDTKYLLDIYDQLRLELENHTMGDVSIVSVLDRSKQVCLIRYDKEAFIPSGYKTIMDGGRRNARKKNKNSKVMTELSSQQEAALKALYDWRDRTARQEDESVQYVCSNAALLRIASNRPATVATLQRLVNPLPPLVMRRSQEILDAISTAVVISEKSKEEEDDGSVKKTTESTSKPTNTSVPQPLEVRRREMLSPILGSAALYQQAGWMTPTLSGGNASSPGTSEESDDEEITKFLDVNDENEGYAATHYSSHSIEMSPPSLENDTAASRDGKRSTRTDGLGTARAGAADGSSVEEDVRVAQRSSALIQKEMVSGKGGGKFGNGFSLIDLIRPVAITEHVDLDKEQTKETNDDSAADNQVPAVASEEDEMTIPKSMKEIYHLSNANRVRGKEKPSLQFPPNDNDTKQVQKLKEDDVDQADAIVSRGGGYFTNNSKRQRTTPGKEGDIKLMTKLGWVKDKKDAESLAVVFGNNGDPQQPAVHGPPQKKSSVNRSSAGSQSLFDNSPTSNYYSNKGGGGGASSVGAYDPNATPSNNPFFSGAATSAASMLHGGDSEGGKSNKKNRHRGRR